MTARTGLIAALAVLATSALCFAGAAISVEEAQAATAAPIATMGAGLNLKAGPHHTVSPTLHAGYWDVKDAAGRVHHMICISYNRRGPDGTAAALSAPLPTPSVEADARLKAAVNAAGTSSDPHVAAQLWFAAAHILVDDPAARSGDAAALRSDLPTYERQLAAGDRAGFRAILAAAAVHAPYAVTVDLQGAVPGQAGKATVRVVGSNGKPAASRPVVFALSGGTVTSAARTTDAAGRATMSFRSIALGQTVTAVVTSPSSTTVYANRPSAGRQVVVGGGFTETTRGSAVAELCPVEASHTTVCPCKKQGDREITITWSAADLTGWYRGAVTVDGTPAAHVDLAAGETGTATIRVKPGQEVSVGYGIYGSATRTGALLVSEVLDAWLQR